MSGYLFSQKKAQTRTAPSTSLRTGLVLIAAVTAISFFSSLDNGFVNWDDDKYVTGNHAIRNLSWITLKTIFTSSYTGIYCPLAILSYTLEYALFGLNPFGYHLTNLLLHIGNSLLVFALVLRLSSHLLPALVAALLFGVHPLHVESVAWVTERKDVLSTLFFLGSVLSYLRYQEDRQARFYVLSLVAFVLSLLAKPIGVTLPLILLLCDYIAARRFNRQVLNEKLPFFLFGLLFGVVAVWAEHSAGAIPSDRSFALGDNILVACWGICFYLGKTLLPLGLSALYPYPPEISTLSPTFSLPLLVLPALTVGVIFSQKYTRKVVFGSLFFFITLLPVLKILPVGHVAAADRFMYIPSIGLFYLFGMAFHRIYTRKTHWEGTKRGTLGLGLTVFLVTFSVLTWQRCNIWQDSETLWLNVLTQYPDAPIAHISLGAAYDEKGRTDDAIAHYQQALASDPNNPLAHNNLGNAYQKKDLVDAAIAEYHKALAADPNDVLTHYNLGNAYQKKGLLDVAITEYHKALTLDPTYAQAHNNLGTVYGGKGLFGAAIAEYHKALTLDPAYAQAHNNLAMVYYFQGNYQLALRHHDRARQLGYPILPQFSQALDSHRE